MAWKQVKCKEELRNFLCKPDRTEGGPECSSGCRGEDTTTGNEFLALKSIHGSFLTAGIGTWTDHVENNQTWVENDEKFTLDFLDKNEVAIRTSANTYWSAQPSGELMADRKLVNAWEKFTLYLNEDATKLAIKTWNNLWVSAQPNGKVEANRSKLDAWETFTEWKQDTSWLRVTSRLQLTNFLSGGKRIPCNASCNSKCQHGDYIPGDEFLVLKSAHGKFLTAGVSTWTDHVENNCKWVKNDEKFTIDFLDNNEVSICTSANTHWSAQPSGELMADRKLVNTWEKFTLYLNEDATKLAIRTWNNRWVSAQPNGKMEANRSKLDVWETFSEWKKDTSWVRVTSRMQLMNFLSGGKRIPCTASCNSKCQHGDYIPGEEFLVLKSAHGKFLTAGVSTWTDHVENNCKCVKNDEKFTIDFLDNNEVSICTSANTYWSAQPSGELMADRKLVNTWEKFILYLNEDATKLAIRTWNNRWVSAQPNGKVEANRSKLDAWETFTEWKEETSWVRVTSRLQLMNFLSGGKRIPCTANCNSKCQHGDYIPGDEFLVLKSAHGKFLTAGVNTWTDHVENNCKWVKNDEKFTIDFLENNEVSICTSANTYWSAQPSGELMADRKLVNKWEKFILYLNEDRTKLAIKTWNDRWVSAQPNGKMEANRMKLFGWEMFTGWQAASVMHKLAGVEFEDSIDGDPVKIFSAN